MLDRVRRSKLLWPLLILLATLAVTALTSGEFVHYKDGHFYGSLIDIFRNGARVMLVAIGMTLVIATGGIDLSVGAVMAIAGATAALLIKSTGLPIGAVVGVALAVGALCGLWNGALVAWFGVQPIIATLILMVAGRGIAQLITNGQILTFSEHTFELLGKGHFAAIPFPVWLVVLTLLATASLTDLTPVRLYLESVGNNRTASRCAGVPVARVTVLAYVVCALCAALAGLIETADINGADVNNAGLYLELDAILAVVIGGTALTGGRFSLVGSVLGALTIQALTTAIITKGINPNVTRVVKALVVVVVCLMQSDVFRAKVRAALGSKTGGSR